MPAPIAQTWGRPTVLIERIGQKDVLTATCPAALELAVEVSIDVGAAFLKTGSGFGPAARVEQVQQLRQLARGRAAVKASGGIADLEQALALVEAGASRLGTSRGVALMDALRHGASPAAREPGPSGNTRTTA